jgi:peptide/nickel transport system substrate-binding protein
VTVANNLVSDAWLTNKPDGHQSERVARGWSWDATGTKLVLQLRPDVYFHDGTLLTPEVAVQLLKATRQNAARDAPSFSTVSDIRPVGQDGVEITVNQPNSFILSDLSAVLVVKPKIQKTDLPIGTGPFQLVSQSEEERFSLQAFPRYYRGQPSLKQLEVINYPTQRNAWVALMRGDVDMLYEVSREAVEFVEKETTVTTYSFPRPYYIPLVFNIRHPILKNAEVRMAINEAVDRVALVRDAMNGRGTPADGPIPPEHWAYSAPARPFIFNPEAARSRLDAAGFGLHPAAGAAPVRFSFECLVFGTDSRFQRLALLLQKQLADVGIDMKLVPVDAPQLVTRIQAGDFDAFQFEMAGRSLGWIYEWWRYHDGMRNNSGYHAADAVLDRLRAARSDDEVRAAVAELGAILHDDPPAAFLAWQSTFRAVSTKFDVGADRNRDLMTNVWRWRPAEPAVQAAGR